MQKKSKSIQDPCSPVPMPIRSAGKSELGVQIIVNSDAHFSSRIGDLAPGEALLQEVCFPKELVLNADEDRFRSYLEHKGIKFED